MRILELVAASFAFFSRIPVPKILLPEKEPPYAMILVVSPLMGGILGAIWGGVGAFLSLRFAALGAAWASAVVYVLLGWGLHLDGLSDIADGWASGKSGEEMREIVKDSRCGPYGVMALILTFGLWTSLLFALPSWRWITIGMIVSASGKWAMCCAACMGNCPWKNSMAFSFIQNFSLKETAYAFVCFVLIFFFGPWMWVLSFLATTVVGVLMSLWAQYRLGGISGDVLGATEVLGEVFALAAITLFTS